MGISNKTGRMLLTTGNKSEMAVGYATLYGDMAGGLRPSRTAASPCLSIGRLAQCPVAGDPSAGHRAPAFGGTQARAKGHRQPAAIRGAGSDPRGVHRRGPVGRSDRGAWLRPRDRRAHPRSGEAKRVQTAPGAARGPCEPAGVRARWRYPITNATSRAEWVMR